MHTNTYPPPPGGAVPQQALAPTVPAQAYPWAPPAPPPAPAPQRRQPARAQPAQQASNGLAVAGMVLGIMSLVLDLTVIGCALGVPVAFIGFVLSAFGAHKPGRGLGIAGIICSAIGFAAPILLAYLITRGW